MFGIKLVLVPFPYKFYLNKPSGLTMEHNSPVNCSEFKEEKNFAHHTSLPTNVRSNRQAEDHHMSTEQVQMCRTRPASRGMCNPECS